MPNPNNNKTFITLIIGAIVAVILYGLLVMPDQRTTSERVADAVDALPQGIDKAADQLERRTPGEKLGDAVEDVGEDIKRNTDRN